jgi:hypothetical protein
MQPKTGFVHVSTVQDSICPFIFAKLVLPFLQCLLDHWSDKSSHRERYFAGTDSGSLVIAVCVMTLTLTMSMTANESFMQGSAVMISTVLMQHVHEAKERYLLDH